MLGGSKLNSVSAVVPLVNVAVTVMVLALVAAPRPGDAVPGERADKDGLGIKRAARCG